MSNEILVKGLSVKYRTINDEDYICLTDIAKVKNLKDSDKVIASWMKNRMTIEYLGLWESINNPNFNPLQMEGFKNNSSLNYFTLSPQEWIKKTSAIGIISQSGRYGGTYAHKDIALEFASWISPEFKLYLIMEFQRLKKEKNDNKEWSVKREFAKLNYKIHTTAIKENIVPILKNEQINFIYANEADLLNVALFGKTATEWKKENPTLKGNIRDYASIEQLLVLANMESYNSILIEKNLSSKERIIQLNNMAKSQLKILNKNPKLLN